MTARWLSIQRMRFLLLLAVTVSHRAYHSNYRNNFSLPLETNRRREGLCERFDRSLVAVFVLHRNPQGMTTKECAHRARIAHEHIISATMRPYGGRVGALRRQMAQHKVRDAFQDVYGREGLLQSTHQFAAQCRSLPIALRIVGGVAQRRNSGDLRRKADCPGRCDPPDLLHKRRRAAKIGGPCPTEGVS